MLVDTVILSVIMGMSVGIGLVVIFASIPMTGSNSFSPESYYDWSPEDGRWPPRIILTEDADSSMDNVPSIQFGYELQLTLDESDD